MANFMGITTSNGAKVKKGKEKELKTYLKKYVSFGQDSSGEEVTSDIENGFLYLYGYAFICVYEDDDLQEDVTDKFLKGLAPFLAKPLVIQSIGNTKCRFPLSAWEAKIYPSGKIVENGFKFYK